MLGLQATRRCAASLADTSEFSLVRGLLVKRWAVSMTRPFTSKRFKKETIMKVADDCVHNIEELVSSL